MTNYRLLVTFHDETGECVHKAVQYHSKVTKRLALNVCMKRFGPIRQKIGNTYVFLERTGLRVRVTFYKEKN